MFTFLTLCTLSVVSTSAQQLWNSVNNVQANTDECAGLVLNRDMLSFQSKHHKQGWIKIYGATSKVTDENYAPTELLMTLTLLPNSPPVVISENLRPHVALAFDVLKIEYKLDSTIEDRREGVYFFQPQCQNTQRASAFPIGKIGTMYYACEAYAHPACYQKGYTTKLDELHMMSAVNNVENARHEKEAKVVENFRNWNIELMREVGNLLLKPIMFMRNIGMGWNHVADVGNQQFGLTLDSTSPLLEAKKVEKKDGKKDDKKDGDKKDEKVEEKKDEEVKEEVKEEEVKVEEEKGPCGAEKKDCPCGHEHRRLRTDDNYLSVNNKAEGTEFCTALTLERDAFAFKSQYHGNGVVRIYGVTSDPSDEHYDADQLLFTYTALSNSKPRVVSQNRAANVSVAFNVLRVVYDVESPLVADRRQGEYFFTPNCAKGSSSFTLGAIGSLQYQCVEEDTHPSCASPDYQNKWNQVHINSVASQLDNFAPEEIPKVVQMNRQVLKYLWETFLSVISAPFEAFQYLGGTFNHIADYVGMDKTKTLRVDKK